MPSTTFQALGSLPMVFQPERSLPLKREIGSPNFTLARSGAGGTGGMRLPVKSACPRTLPSSPTVEVVSFMLSPSSLAVMVSVVFRVLPSASFCRDSLTRVTISVYPSIFVLVTGTTLPPPQRMVPLSCAPSFVTPSQPAPPPGMVKAQLPRKGFSAATAEVVMSATALTMSARRFACEKMRIDAFILRALRGGKENVGVAIRLRYQPCCGQDFDTSP